MTSKEKELRGKSSHTPNPKSISLSAETLITIAEVPVPGVIGATLGRAPVEGIGKAFYCRLICIQTT